jgi:hypothetical protein
MVRADRDHDKCRVTRQLLVDQGGADITGNLLVTGDLSVTGDYTGLPVQTQRAVVSDVKASTTQGGTFTAGAWRTRDLNTEYDPDGIVTISSNQFTLQAGTYIIIAQAAALNVGENQLRIRNITDTTTSITGVNNYCLGSITGSTATLMGGVTIAAQKTFELQHRCLTTQITYGFGTSMSFDNEVYSQIEIIKVIA